MISFKHQPSFSFNLNLQCSFYMLNVLSLCFFENDYDRKRIKNLHLLLKLNRKIQILDTLTCSRKLMLQTWEWGPRVVHTQPLHKQIAGFR